MLHFSVKLSLYVYFCVETMLVSRVMKTKHVILFLQFEFFKIKISCEMHSHSNFMMFLRASLHEPGLASDSNVWKRLHEKNSQAGQPLLLRSGLTRLERLNEIAL